MARALGFSIAFILALAVLAACSSRQDEQGMQASKGRKLSEKSQVFAEYEKVAENEKGFRNTASPAKFAEDGAAFDEDYKDPGANTDPHGPTPPST